MRYRLAMALMRHRWFRHFPSRLQNWAIEHYLMSIPSYRAYVESLRGEPNR